MTPKRTNAELIAHHRAELERLTGKMVSLRDRKKFNEKQRALQKARRKRVTVNPEYGHMRAVLEGD